MDTFSQAGFICILGAVIGGILSLALVLPVASCVKRFTRVAQDKRQKRASQAWLLLTVAFVVLQLFMHFSMRSELGPLEAAFKESAYMQDGDVRASDEIVAERNRLLDRHGYVHIGRWWARWGYTTPDVDTGGIVYVYIPFL